MFLCARCHRTCPCFAFGGSYGKCENCERVTACVDCHSNVKLPVPDDFPAPTPAPSEARPIAASPSSESV